MIPPYMAEPLRAMAFPRTRGDDPKEARDRLFQPGFSPHPRG